MSLKALLFAIIFTAQVSCQAIVNTDFGSAVTVNVCSEKNGGYGSGRVLFKTTSCECVGFSTFRARCQRTLPNAQEGHVEVLERMCDPRDSGVWCLPTDESSMLEEDCACRRYPKKYGSKEPHDTDGIACSGGLKIEGSRPIDIWSTITLTTPSSKIEGCWVQDGRREYANKYPCDSGSVLQFDPGSTYQACIEGLDDTPTRINFEWSISSPWGHLKRDLLERGSFEDLVYVRSSATNGSRASITIVNEDGVEIKRFGT